MIEKALLAAAAGVCGALIGGTPTFIMTGFAGILAAVLEAAGVDGGFYNETVMNVFFLPAILFNGSVAATAYAARKYPINGWESWRSLLFTNDPMVYLAGALGGFGGYWVFSLAGYLGIPCDTGALTVLTIGLFCRLCLSTGRKYNPEGRTLLARLPGKVWLSHIIMAGCVSFATGWFALKTGYYTIAFSISALSLIFLIIDPGFPVTHHITITAGYAAMATGNIWASLVFGIIAELLCYSFTILFNDKCSTHLDPPAFAIFVCSLCLFVFFR